MLKKNYTVNFVGYPRIILNELWMFALFDCCVAKVSVFSTFPYRVSLTIFEYEDTQGDP